MWWVHNGVAHKWSAEAEWCVELDERVNMISADFDDDSEPDRERDVSEEAGQLARDPQFQKARTGDQREYIARKTFPELGGTDGDAKFDWTYVRLVRQAQGIYEVDILPGEEREIAERARDAIEVGKSRSAAAEELGVSSDRLRRILQTNPAP